jgi:TRAP-type mannitol/chloroaromatic compound transport system permease small subunit
MNKKAQAGVFGIILFLVLFIILFVYLTPFFSTTSDASANSSNVGISGWFFGNFGFVIFIVFVVVILWRIGVG